MGFPVKHIDFGGQKRPVKYGMNALSIIAKLESIDLANITALGDGIDFSLMRTIVFAGLQEGARAEREAFSLTIEDVGDIMDGSIDIAEDFVQLMSDQMPKPKKVKAPGSGH
jgi:hypothetical protein